MFVIITQNICSCCFCLNYSIWGYKVLMLLVALRILMFHCYNLLRISVQLNRNYIIAAWENNIFYTNKKNLAPFHFIVVKVLAWQFFFLAYGSVTCGHTWAPAACRTLLFLFLTIRGHSRCYLVDSTWAWLWSNVYRDHQGPNEKFIIITSMFLTSLFSHLGSQMILFTNQWKLSFGKLWACFSNMAPLLSIHSHCTWSEPHCSNQRVL